MLNKKINGIPVACRLKGEGPPLVLLHGFTQDSRVWKPQLDSLSNEFTLIAWDAPGAGRSADPPGTFTINDWADSLTGLLDSIGVKQAHILGLSWGGILAQVFYKHYPRYVFSLILADTYAGWRGSLPEPVTEERLAGCLRDASLPPGKFVPKYLPGMFSDSVTKKVREYLANIMSDFHPAGFRLMAMSSAIDTFSILPSIEVPVLLIWGEQDKRSPISIADQLHTAIPGSKLEIISGAGHISSLEKPVEFNKNVSDFCLAFNVK